MHPVFGLALALFLVLLNGFFVAAEFALVKVRRTQLQERAKGGNRVALLSLHAVHHLDAYLSATQLGITLASIGLGWVGEPTVARLLEPLFSQWGVEPEYRHGLSFAIAFTAISMFHIVLGELAPKSWAIQQPERMTTALIYPLHWFYILFKPAIWALNGLAGRLLKWVGLQGASDHEAVHSGEEIQMLVRASGLIGVLDPTEAEIAGRVLTFADKRAREVMIPRVDVVALDIRKDLARNLEIAQSQPYSRYPVVEEDLDSILGVVHVRDLFTLPEGKGLETIVRPTPTVPHTRSLADLLHDFQRTHRHMAIVLDEHGGTAGIVTLEDVLEQIVGEIADEYDVDPAQIERSPDGAWSVQGRARMQRVSDELGIELPGEGHETVGAFVAARLGHAPRLGDRLHLEGVEVEVVDVAKGRISRLRLRTASPKNKKDLP